MTLASTLFVLLLVVVGGGGAVRGTVLDTVGSETGVAICAGTSVFVVSIFSISISTCTLVVESNAAGLSSGSWFDNTESAGNDEILASGILLLNLSV